MRNGVYDGTLAHIFRAGRDNVGTTPQMRRRQLRHLTGQMPHYDPTGTNTTVTSDTPPLGIPGSGTILGDLSSLLGGGGGASASSTSAATTASDVVQNAAAQPVLGGGSAPPPAHATPAPIVVVAPSTSSKILGFFKSTVGLALVAVLLTVGAVLGYRHYGHGHKRLHAHH